MPKAQDRASKSNSARAEFWGRDNTKRRKTELSRRYRRACSALPLLPRIPPTVSRNGRSSSAGPFAALCASRRRDQASPARRTRRTVDHNGVPTPNDRFYVRWHWSVIPTSIDVKSFRLTVHGHVNQSLSLSLDDLMTLPQMEIAAVNQCSGNSRGYFQPRVSGAQWSHGSMGNAARHVRRNLLQQFNERSPEVPWQPRARQHFSRFDVACAGHLS